MADLEYDGLQDVSNSQAYQILDQLVDQLEIPVEKADAARHKYAKLHGILLQAMTRERQLLDEAKTLKRAIDAERSHRAGDDLGPGGAEAAIDRLREDVESAMGEAALAQERQQLLQLEVTDLQRQRNEVAQRMEEMATEHAAALQPMIANLRADVSNLRLEVDEGQERYEQAVQELKTSKERLAQLQEDIAVLQSSKTSERSNMHKVDGLPDKARRQSEAVAGALKNVQGQLESANLKLQEADNTYRAHVGRERELQEEHMKLLNTLDRGRIQVEAKERHADDIRKDVELAGIEADKILADQVDLDLKIKNAGSEVKLEHEALSRKSREKELALRQYKATEVALKEAQDSLPNLRFQVEQLNRDKAVLEGKLREGRKELEELKRDLDISMNDFLREEAVGKDKAALFQLTFKQVSLMEEELAHLKKREAEHAKILMELGSQRDRVALSIAQKLAKVKEVEQNVRIKEVELAELKKIKREVARRIRDYEKLYELIKNQRNKFVNLIQAANQSTTEMKDKSRILSNELDILHGEVHTKDKLLKESRSQHQSAITERDQLRIELGKFGATFRDKQRVVDEQIAEVDKLNAIINSTEKEMLKLRKQYEVVIESRNYTGIMLIDRNDELCILYEKHNIQDEVVKSGVLELKRREDEIRLLNIEICELERSIAVTIKLVPQIPLLDEDVARLQKALLETRREAEALSVALENPGNHSRWRLLEGKIPDKEELSAKIQQLEERLNDKKEALLEKELILEEITGLSDKLRAQASEGRADTLELAKKVNEYQGKLRGVTRKIMATVSELSMYQATSIKLGAEKEELEGEVDAARERMALGAAPSEDAEREWYRLERSRLLMEEFGERQAEEVALLDAKISEVQSTAEPRPNAYIPESLGIPKPYGNFAPFKPSEAGSSMRHIRKPNPREIII
mmetsp:Transcript_40583/g.90203  ORF Transcript_40583/g.90203 Transcript_40583/m.90203 type:complete len:924 (-) Transcript_40583:938-3709(-)